MFCTNCGTKLDEGARFCLRCGTMAEAEGPAASAPAAAGQPVQPANQYTAPPVRRQQSNGDVPAAAHTAYNAAPAAGQNKNPWQYFCGVWKKYAVFSGRARRAEYWWFALFNVIILFALGFIDGYAYLYITDDVGLLSTLYNLAILLPGLAVAVRRMHDCGKNGWYLLIPIYGWIVLPCTKGTPGPNQYGPDPKQTNE